MNSEPGTDLERRQQIKPVAIPTDDEIRREWRIAEALAASGMFPDAQEAAKAFAKILVGRDLGLSPTQALMGVYLVKGKPQVASTLLAGFIKRTPGYDYEVTTHTDHECTIAFTIDGEPAGLPVTFTMDDAVRAELVNVEGEGEAKRYKRRQGASEGWEKYPKNMLFARAMSNGVKWLLPDATGGVAVYAEGELTDGTRPELTEGTGSGEAAGLDLGPKVEKVLERAAALGHEAIADRATAEMALGGRAPEVATRWVAEREAELDEFENREVPEAVVVETGVEGELSPDEAKSVLESIASSLESDAAEAEADGEAEKAAELRKGAQEMRDQAEAAKAASESEAGDEA